MKQYVGHPSHYKGAIRVALQSLQWLVESSVSRRKHQVTLDKDSEDLGRISDLREFLQNLTFLNWCADFITEEYGYHHDQVRACLLRFATCEVSEESLQTLYYRISTEPVLKPMKAIPTTMQEWLLYVAVHEPNRFVAEIDATALADSRNWPGAHARLYDLISTG